VTALLVIDVIDTFRHEGGERLLTSLRARIDGLERTIDGARERGWPVVYVNDNRGAWDGDAPALIREAVEEGLGGPLVARLAPRPGDRFVVKPAYSGFEATPLRVVLDALGARRVALMGAATEMCVRDTAIDATRHGLETAVVAEGCITQDPELERLALEAMARLVGARVVREVAEL
jgi:nicotinamidase-related amidase